MSFSQTAVSSFGKLSRPERCWLFFHPFIAKKAHALTLKARAETELVVKDTLLDRDDNGGQVDAFRHSYWMALLAQKIRPKKAAKLGRAHEKGNYISFKKGEYEEGAIPDSLASVMDLHNNEAGLKIGKENKDLSEAELKQRIIRSVLQGEMRVFRKDPKGNYLDCSGKIIDLAVYKGKWSIPKCLVGSAK